jgi:hypothetical protein
MGDVSTTELEIGDEKAHDTWEKAFR